jgi:nitric oxide reductase large subunit
VQPQKAHKIDLNNSYPCPCRRRGHLVPIALTEAFGCDRCQQIFVVQESGYAIEQLSTNYPYKRAWRWTGHQWNMAHASLGRGYLPLTLVIIFGVVFLLLLITLQSPQSASVPFRIIAALVLSMMLVLMLWLACRR